MSDYKRAVKSIWFQGANGDYVIHSKDEVRLEYISLYLGDRTDEHICEIDKDGTEIKRHNCRYIATIEWA